MLRGGGVLERYIGLMLIHFEASALAKISAAAFIILHYAVSLADLISVTPYTYPFRIELIYVIMV